MLKEKIEKYFHRDAGLRVLFFFDPDKTWLQDVEALNIDDISVIKWNNNDFYLKTQLHGPLKNERVFLYFPFASPKTQEEYKKFPLLDLLMANRELSLEDEGEFMQEYGLQRHQQALVKKYMRELKYGNVQEVCKPLLNAASFYEPALIKGLLSSFLRFSRIESWPLIVGKILLLCTPGEENELKRFQKKVEDNDLFETVVNVVKEWTGTVLPDLYPSNLKSVLTRIRYNRLTQNISQPSSSDLYRSFKIKEPDQLHRMNQMMHELGNNERLSEALNDALDWAGESIKGERLIEAYGAEQVFAEYTPDMVFEIVAKSQDKIGLNPVAVRKRMGEISFQKDLPGDLHEVLKLLIQASLMYESINSINTYILNRPEEYLSAYTERWFKIDTAFRRAILSFRAIDIDEVPEKVNLAEILDSLNKKYDTHCEQLNREWLKCLAHFSFNYKNIGVPKQYEFFKKHVAPYEQKVVVIISDALRYEAARELLAEMHGDPRNTADISFQLTGLPSKTFMGMAQLLPGSNYTFNEGNITIDGISTEGTENRRKILERINPEAIAISFHEVDALGQEEKRAFFKRPLVYVYHDVIDSTGDNRKSEKKVFEAVNTAIDELKRFVKSLHASYNVSRVLITADHGFIYNDRKIEEADKENLSGADAIVTGNRFELLKNCHEAVLGYCIPLDATTVFKESLYVLTPESVNRYKKQGVGHQYAHGGGSLQELVVPVIESSRKRQDVTTKVNVMLMQKTLTIVSNVLRVNILQENQVSKREKERKTVLGIYHQTELVSNQKEVLLNSTSDSPTDRVHRVDLNLSSTAFNISLLKLKVFDADDMLNPLIEAVVENKNLIEPDF